MRTVAFCCLLGSLSLFAHVHAVRALRLYRFKHSVFYRFFLAFSVIISKDVRDVIDAKQRCR